MTQTELIQNEAQAVKPEEGAAASEPSRIVHIYLKGIQMKQPNSPAVLFAPGPLKMDMQLKVTASQPTDAIYEVSLQGSIKTRTPDDLVVYEIDVEQAGLFNLQGVAQEDLGTVIGVQCTHLLYPYLRTYVSDTVTRAGFVPLHMGEVSFAPVVIERSSDERPSELAA